MFGLSVVSQQTEFISQTKVLLSHLFILNNFRTFLSDDEVKVLK